MVKKRNIHKTKKKSKNNFKNTNKNKKVKKKTGSKRKKYKKISDIIDPPLSNKVSLGSFATEGDIDFHYQAYANIFDFFNNILEKDDKLKDILCFPSSQYDFLNSFLKVNLDEDDINSSELVERNVRLRNSESGYKELIKLIKNCENKSKRFCVVTVMIIVPGKPGSHANIIVIDLKEKSVELFEPHAKTTEISTLDSLEGAYFICNRLIKKTFSKILPDYKYISPNDYLPRYGLQSKTDEYTGLCVTWSILYVHYRILNPDKPRNILIKHMNKLKKRFLLRYAAYIEEVIKNKN